MMINADITAAAIGIGSVANHYRIPIGHSVDRASLTTVKHGTAILRDIADKQQFEAIPPDIPPPNSAVLLEKTQAVKLPQNAPPPQRASFTASRQFDARLSLMPPPPDPH
jgi:hypothetical protein